MYIRKIHIIYLLVSQKNLIFAYIQNQNIMVDIVKIASYICSRYRQQYGKDIDEMKLHKLLYFTQRESIIQKGEPLFKECFEAWKYGPVMVCIRQKYQNNTLNEELSPAIIQDYKSMFDFVFETYAQKDSWSLSSITHGEYAWLKARQQITPKSQHVIINTDDIREDANRVKIRRFVYEKVNSLVAKTNNHADN